MKEQSATMIKITETTVRGDEHEAPVERTFRIADEAKAFLKNRLTEWYEEQGFGTEDAESEAEDAWTLRGIFVTLREDGVEPLMFRLDIEDGSRSGESDPLLVDIDLRDETQRRLEDEALAQEDAE